MFNVVDRFSIVELFHYNCETSQQHQQTTGNRKDSFDF